MAYLVTTTMTGSGSELEFDVTAQHLTTGASENVLDLGAAPDLNDSTMTVTVETDATDSFSSPTTTQTVGTLAVGSAVGTKLSPGTINERYARLRFNGK